MDQQIHKICHNVYKKCFGKGKKNNKLQLFLQPVDLKKYPDYVKKIKGNKPMDLATLKKNLNVKYTRSAYATFDDLYMYDIYTNIYEVVSYPSSEFRDSD